MNCFHGIGPGHLLIDLLMVLPLVAPLIYWLKVKVNKDGNFGKSKSENVRGKSSVGLSERPGKEKV